MSLFRDVDAAEEELYRVPTAICRRLDGRRWDADAEAAEPDI